MHTQNSNYVTFFAFLENDPTQCGKISQVCDWSFQINALLIRLWTVQTLKSDYLKLGFRQSKPRRGLLQRLLPTGKFGEDFGKSPEEMVKHQRTLPSCGF